MEIVRIAQKQSDVVFDDIAKLHISEIHHGALPLLGEKFLARLYYDLAGATRTGIWGAIEAGRMLGFLAGTADARFAYRTVLLKDAVSLVLRASHSLLLPGVLRKIPAIYSYAFHREGTHSGVRMDRPYAELLAIAVDRNVRGRGVGKMLIEAFEEALIAWGIRGHYWVATNIADSDSNLFYQKMGFVPSYTRKHHDLTLQIYQKAISNG